MTQTTPCTMCGGSPGSCAWMHYAHVKKRGRDEFRGITDAGWKKMGVKNPKGSRLVCYECHEVILHNPVLSEDQVDQLAVLFRGKSFEDRVVILNSVIAKGLAACRTETAAPHSIGGS
jgi:hypothetical protein